MGEGHIKMDVGEASCYIQIQKQFRNHESKCSRKSDVFLEL